MQSNTHIGGCKYNQMYSCPSLYTEWGLGWLILGPLCSYQRGQMLRFLAIGGMCSIARDLSMPTEKCTTAFLSIHIQCKVNSVEYLLYYDLYLILFPVVLLFPWVLSCCQVTLWMHLTASSLSPQETKPPATVTSGKITVKKKRGLRMRNSLILAPNSLVFVVSSSFLAIPKFYWQEGILQIWVVSYFLFFVLFWYWTRIFLLSYLEWPVDLHVILQFTGNQLGIEHQLGVFKSTRAKQSSPDS